MIPHRHGRLLAGTLAAFAALSLVACGSDDDDAVAVAAPPATVVPTTAPPPPVEPAPTTEAPVATAPDTTTEHSAHTGDGAPIVAVNAIDYKFENLPASVPVGTALSLHNSSDVELHEIVAIQIPDNETRSLDELVTLPQAELDQIFAGLPALVMIAPPGQDGFAVLGDGTLSEPGRYAVVCSIPIGADPQAFLEAAETSDGPPDVPGGPPHFTAGMFAELIVEAA